jgi:ABC-type phosphonate transport system ATPase subunit
MRGGVIASGHSGNAQKIEQVEKKLGDDKSTIAYDTKMRQHYTEAAKNAKDRDLLRTDLSMENAYGYDWARAERNEMMLKRELSRLQKQ